MQAILSENESETTEAGEDRRGEDTPPREASLGTEDGAGACTEDRVGGQEDTESISQAQVQEGTQRDEEKTQESAICGQKKLCQNVGAQTQHNATGK